MKTPAYSREVNGFKKLFVKELQGEPQQLTAGTGDDIQPKWTPDGQSILFVRSNQPRGKLEPGECSACTRAETFGKGISPPARREIFSTKHSILPSPPTESCFVVLPAAGPGASGIVDAQGHNPQQITSDSSEAVDHLKANWSPRRQQHRVPRMWNARNSALKFCQRRDARGNSAHDGRFQA